MSEFDDGDRRRMERVEDKVNGLIDRLSQDALVGIARLDRLAYDTRDKIAIMAREATESNTAVMDAVRTMTEAMTVIGEKLDQIKAAATVASAPIPIKLSGKKSAGTVAGVDAAAG